MEKLNRKRSVKFETEGDEDEDELRITTKLFKQGEDIGYGEAFKCQDLRELEIPFWLTCLSCMCTYISIINSIIIGSAVLQNRFGFPE